MQPKNMSLPILISLPGDERGADSHFRPAARGETVRNFCNVTLAAYTVTFSRVEQHTHLVRDPQLHWPDQSTRHQP